MISCYVKYNKKHLEFLMDEFVKSYHNKDFDNCDKLKKQISNIKEILNSFERTILEPQTLKILEDSKL
jgi:hypothetical protein